MEREVFWRSKIENDAEHSPVGDGEGVKAEGDGEREERREIFDF